MQRKQPREMSCDRVTMRTLRRSMVMSHRCYNIHTAAGDFLPNLVAP